MTTASVQTYPTLWVEIVLDNSTGSEVYPKSGGSNSSSIFGLLWPSLFTACIIVANFLTLAAFCVNKKLRTYNNYFIINLSILDLLSGVYLIITVVHTHVGYYPLNQTLCKILSGISQAIIGGSNFVVVIICADRHRATYDPINHFMTRSKRKALFLNSLAWLGAFSFWMLFITTWEFVDNFDNGRHCVRRYTNMPGVSIVNGIVIFYLPLVIISVLYLRIFLKIRKTRGGKLVEKKFDVKDNISTAVADLKKDTATSSLNDPVIDTDVESVREKEYGQDMPRRSTGKAGSNINTKPIRKRESAAEMRKATRTLLFIVLSFVVAWLPQSIIGLIYSIKPLLVFQGLPRPGRLFFTWLASCNSLLNPISYAVSQPLLRSTLKNMLFNHCKERSPQKSVNI
ncbi:muscarinic acetylcholine receptor M4-like [Diadema antillarum]|uniref:muscarinic acetylcholine receptor M4-like n=1 Tax=Diadema antillarum TaxID=105358 RepID=UPI003A8BC42A